MFNFNELKVIKGNESENRNYGSFVGIRKDSCTQEMIFNLPRGFDDFDINYENIKKIFFGMYKTFKKFIKSRKNLYNISDYKPQSKDNMNTDRNNSYRFTDTNNNEIIMYSKIDMIDKIMSVQNLLDLDALIQEVGLLEDIDYSDIDNLVNNGVFLKNNSIIIDFMHGTRNAIHSIPSEIIEIYCYIYNEVLVELEYEVDEKVKDISYNFSYQYLTSEQSLFNENNYESTIKILKDRLDITHRNTSYKNNSYWIVYEAVENFLYGSLEFDENEGQGFWGINNFYQIWEDMCNSFFIKNIEKDKILYCDSALRLENKVDNLKRENFGGFNILIDSNFDNNFNIKFNKNERWMRPDLIVHKSNNSIIKSLIDNGIISYEFEKSKNLLMNSLIKVRLNHKKVYDDVPSYEFQNKVFDYIINKFQGMSHRNPRKGISKKYHSLAVKKVNSKLYYFNGITEKDFLLEWNGIVEDTIRKESNHDIYCIDWKYLPISFFDKDSKDLKSNVVKQLTYEFCLKNNAYCKDKKIKSQFILPSYKTTESVIDIYSEIDEIEVCMLNFDKVQSVYLYE